MTTGTLLLCVRGLCEEPRQYLGPCEPRSPQVNIEMQKLADSVQTELHKAQGKLPCLLGIAALLKEAQAQVHALFPPGACLRASNSVASIMPYFRDTAHTLAGRMTFYLHEAQMRVFSDEELSAIADSLLAHHEISASAATDDCEVVAEHTADQIRKLQEARHDLTAAQTCYATLRADSGTVSAQVARLTDLLGKTKAAHAEVLRTTSLRDQAQTLLDKAQADLDRVGLPDQAQALLDTAQADLTRISRARHNALESLRTVERKFAEAEKTYTTEGAQAAKRHKGSGGAH
jgi:hypothetical protein